MTNKLPSVSFVVPTFNSEKTLEECLTSIRKQRYPVQKMEIILSDGGSKDNTKKLAKKFACRFISIKAAMQGAEYNRAVGAKNAKNEILVFLDHDNILPHSNWLRNMIIPFFDARITGAETLRYAYEPKAKALGRYFSLLCANDVVPFYLGKADRLSYIYDNLKQYGIFKKLSIKNYKGYSVVTFTKNHIPTLGSNGFVIRRKVLMMHAQVKPSHFFHIDVNVDLINKGFNKYAFVNDSIIHQTNERGLIDYVRRRKLFVERYQFDQSSNRRYRVYEKGDLGKIILFVIIALTFIVPLYDAIKGFLKVRDVAWFIHPLVCFLLVIVYGYTIARRQVLSYGK